MAFTPGDNVEKRIEEACREYADPDSNMNVLDLEQRIERAFRIEYTFDELMDKMEFHRPAGAHGTAMMFGKEIEPGGSIRFDDMIDLDPRDVHVDPWDEEDLRSSRSIGDHGSPQDNDEEEFEDAFWRQRVADGAIVACTRLKEFVMGSEPEWVDDNTMVVQGDVEVQPLDTNRKI